MLFTGVREARGGRARPALEFRIARARIARANRLREPGVEHLGLRDRDVLDRANPEIVEAHATSDDEDALLTQGCERHADLEMRLRVEPALQRQLHDRNVSAGIDQLEWHEDAMIQPSRVLFASLETGAFQYLAQLRNEGGRAGRGVSEPVGVLR